MYNVEQWIYKKEKPSDVDTVFDDFSESSFDSLDEALKDYNDLVNECSNRYNNPEYAIVGSPLEVISYGPDQEGTYIRKTVVYWGDEEEYLLLVETGA